MNSDNLLQGGFLNAGTLEFIEEQYERFLQDPNSVEKAWRDYFAREVLPADPGGLRAPELPPRSIFRGAPAAASGVGAPDALAQAVRLSRVYQLVHAYRDRGHLVTDLDPLDQRPIPKPRELELATWGFSENDLSLEVPSGGFVTDRPTLKLGELVAALKETYCRHIGVEYLNLQEPEEVAWLQARMEKSRNRRPLTREEQVTVLEKLAAAEGLEQFLHTKYVGTKRFSLEGAESLIPMLDMIIERAAQEGIDEIVMGMPHRGRLNVLTNILGQEPSKLFAQFDDISPESTLGSGDVKYHLGYSRDHETRGGRQVHLTLSSNPSHLEAVDPVVEGRARAKQDRRQDWDRAKVMPILMHGDAAFAGQGLVPETLNLAQLQGYRTGGTIHIVVNNQIGFTTPPSSSRSTPYSTDVAKMMGIPIFHVNGEDPESVAQVVELAVAFRQAFKKDVVIDMYCFRKYGHNESDEPNFTQPLMYRVIEAHPSIPKVYTERMVATGTISRAEAEAIVARERARLEAELDHIRHHPEPARPESMGGIWAGYLGGADTEVPLPETGVALETLKSLAEKISSVPEGFTPHKKISKLLATRRSMGRGELELDWAMGEALAFGSLVLEGYPIRLSGQDSRRGTFSQRHSVVIDVNNGEEFYPLCNLAEKQASFHVYDSSLSEAGVLGFDYGYSLDFPNALVMWEAQFGDFANGAQVIIDQFIASSEDKWRRLSGIVLLLPHGYEGQGPEHSSARLERFLQLCARDNIQVVNCTTPSQYFHLLRRQVVRPLRKPLVVMTPKSLLRAAQATSRLEDLATGRFQRVLQDGQSHDPQAVTRALLCSGKVYYDLVEERTRLGMKNLPIIRVEQLYPFPQSELEALFASWPNLRQLDFVQEEPRNMGAWTFMRVQLEDHFGARYAVRGFSRNEGASPATGSHKAHHIETHKLLHAVFES